MGIEIKYLSLRHTELSFTGRQFKRFYLALLAVIFVKGFPPFSAQLQRFAQHSLCWARLLHSAAA